MYISGGEVYYMQRVKTGDYEHKEAKASMLWHAMEGEDFAAIADKATCFAKAKVQEMLSHLPMRAELKAVQELAAAGSPLISGPPPKPRGRPKSAPKTAATELLDDEAEAEELKSDDSDLLTAASDKLEMSDKELNDKITAHNSKVLNPAAIRGLIQKYVGPGGKRAHDIPQDKRNAFVLELGKIKADPPKS